MTINSTTIYEALLNGIPCVTTGLSCATVPNVCLQLKPDNMKDIVKGLAHEQCSPEAAKTFMTWLLQHQYSPETFPQAVQEYIEANYDQEKVGKHGKDL